MKSIMVYPLMLIELIEVMQNIQLNMMRAQVIEL